MREVIPYMHFKAEDLVERRRLPKNRKLQFQKRVWVFTVTEKIRAFSSCQLEVDWRSKGTCTIQLGNQTAKGVVLSDYNKT